MRTHPSADDTAELLAQLTGSTAGSGMALYDRFADRVHDFVLFLTRDGGLAAEITRDVVVMTANSPTPFEGVDELRAWLYAQARNETFALLAARGRLPSEDRVIPLDPLPEDHGTADLAAMVWTASAAFSERDLALLTLHLRHGLEGSALGEAMGLSADAVDVLLPGTLARVSTQATALLALADGGVAAADGATPQLRALREEWDGTFSPLVRRRALEIAEELESAVGDLPCPLELLQSVPLSPAPASLRDAVEERLRLTGAMAAGGVAQPAVDGAALDDTIPPPSTTLPPPSTTLPPPSTTPQPLGDDATTVPPVSAAAVPATGSGGDPAVDPGSELGVTSAAPSHGAASGDLVASAEVASAGAVAGGGRSDDPPGRGRWRVPPVLAVALGVAFALVVAAALLRTVADDDPSAAEGLTPVVLATPPTEGGVSPAPAPQPGPSASAAPRFQGAGAAIADAPGMPDAVTAATPGSIGLPAGALVVGVGAAVPLRLTNPGGTAVQWQIVERPGWLVTEEDSGTVGPGAAVEVLVSSAGELAEGDYTGQIVIGWGGAAAGTVRAEVQGVSERAPVLQNIQIGSRALLARGCGLDQTEVAVTVADESPLSAVTVIASRPGEATTTRFTLDPDPAQPGRHLGVVGPFDGAGTLTLRIEATDARGNDAEADGGSLTIAPCPGG